MLYETHCYVGCSLQPAIQKFGRQLREHGDEIDSAELQRKVMEAVRGVLRKMSVYQVTSSQFVETCDSVIETLGSAPDMTRVSSTHTHAHTHIHTLWVKYCIINPQRACAARITVVESVCLLPNISLIECLFVPQTIRLS